MSGSTPATPKAATGIAALSVRETEILGVAWSCLKTGPPDIDYEKLADMLGMANPRSASNAWGGIKKKMAWNLAAATPATGKSTPATNKRKKAAANPKTVAESDDEDDNDSPAPKKRATAKPKATPRKKATPTKAAKPTKASGKDEEASADEAAAKEEQVEPEPKVKEEPTAEEQEDDCGADYV